MPTKPAKKWIQKLDLKEGALRSCLSRKYGLKSNEKITKALLDKAESETMSPTILKRINLARTFKKMKHSHKATSGLEAISSELTARGVKHVMVLASGSFDKRSALNGYLKSMLWSSTGEDGEPLDDNYDTDDITSKAKTQSLKDILKFRAYCEKTCIGEVIHYSNNFSDAQFGHDFWLSRNGHGAGFFDRGHGYKQLQKAAKTYGEVNPYVSDAGKIEV